MVVIALAVLNQVPGVQTASGDGQPDPQAAVAAPAVPALLPAGLADLVVLGADAGRAGGVAVPGHRPRVGGGEARPGRREGSAWRDAPLFLLLGRPDEGEEALFAGMSPVVGGAPSYAEAPLHVYATREAIYVTCVGASLLGAHCRDPRRRADPEQGGPRTSTARAGTRSAAARRSARMISTRRPSRAFSAVREVGAIEAGARKEGRAPTKAEQVTIRRLKRLLAQADRPQVLHAYAEEVERQTARLRHLGRLIARDRRPFCGVNGILLLIPMAATDDESDAHETGVCCQEDLATAREAMQVQCPVFALVCGLEQVPGFDAFISHFSPEQLRRRVGQRFPLVPDLAPDQVPAMIDGGVKWLGLNVFPSLALPHWRLEVPGVTDLGEAVRGNAGLFHFLVRDPRAPGVGQPDPRAAAWPGRHSAAATSPRRDAAPIAIRPSSAPMFSRLLEEQDFVAGRRTPSPRRSRTSG